MYQTSSSAGKPLLRVSARSYNVGVSGDKRSIAVSPAGASDANRALRSIPSVNELVESPAVAKAGVGIPRSLVVDTARMVIEEYRAEVLRGSSGNEREIDELVRRVVERLEEASKPRLRATINATGIIIHTGLGRAPLAREAVAALAEAAANYAPVELDMPTGERGHRSFILRDLLCSITGAESATVVNNNAAALLITLTTLARGREVIVSRGELIEIGGSFRLPEVMAQSGAVLREVGTTNKTRLSDYEKAFGENTAAILTVHPSNYRVLGFTEAPEVSELSKLAKQRSVPLVHDIGSGVLYDMRAYGLRDEPDAKSSIAAGADLVLFSGDKLLGGPQAGIIVGRKALVSQIEKHPLMRALRLDKLTLSALAATLQLHRDPHTAAERVPVLRMLNIPVEQLVHRAEGLAKEIGRIEGVAAVEVSREESYVGGGSLPTQAIASAGVRIRARDMDEAELARRLRMGSPPVLPRVREGWVILDLRTVFAKQDDLVVSAVRAAVRAQ